MCLILFSWKVHPDYQLVLAANRDEFYARPTKVAGFWEDHPDILAGRDMEAGGTWMGLSKSGRFAAITNYRDPSLKRINAPSRGGLTTDFLLGDMTPQVFLEGIDRKAEEYYGYNLLLSDGKELWYYSNISRKMENIAPGSYGLSNAFLDTSWPKVELGKELFNQSTKGKIDDKRLVELLHDSTKPSDERLPSTGVSYEWEKAISSMFIETETYGTCCSTIVLMDEDSAHFVEKSYPVGDRQEGMVSFNIELDAGK